MIMTWKPENSLGKYNFNIETEDEYFTKAHLYLMFSQDNEYI